MKGYWNPITSSLTIQLPAICYHYLHPLGLSLGQAHWRSEQGAQKIVGASDVK